MISKYFIVHLIVRPRLAIERQDSLMLGESRRKFLDLRSKTIHDNTARLGHGINMLVNGSKLTNTVKRTSSQHFVRLALRNYFIQAADRRPNRCDLTDKPAWEHVQIIPRLDKFSGLVNSKTSSIDAVALLQEHQLGIESLHRRPKSFDRNVQFQVLGKLPPQKLAPVLFAVNFDLCHRAPVSEKAAAKRNKGRSQRLPFAEIERDHQNKYDHRSSGDTGPFEILHQLKLPACLAFVEATAA